MGRLHLLTLGALLLCSGLPVVLLHEVPGTCGACSLWGTPADWHSAPGCIDAKQPEHSQRTCPTPQRGACEKEARRRLQRMWRPAHPALHVGHGHRCWAPRSLVAGTDTAPDPPLMRRGGHGWWVSNAEGSGTAVKGECTDPTHAHSHSHGHSHGHAHSATPVSDAHAHDHAQAHDHGHAAAKPAATAAYGTATALHGWSRWVLLTSPAAPMTTG